MTTRGHKKEMGTRLEAGMLADLRDWQQSAEAVSKRKSRQDGGVIVINFDKKID